MIGRLLYGALFVLAMPLALAAWAARLDRLIALPLPPIAPSGPWIAALGATIMAAGTWALWQHGRGLPMSAYPPSQLVTRGIYAVLANPLYVGAVLLAGGLSLATASPAGTWIVTPVLALLATAWVAGFEAAHTRALFGALPRPAVHLPDAEDRAPTPAERVGVLLRVLLPWLVAFMAVEWLGVPPDARTVPRLPGEDAWPVLPWTEALYLGTYVMVLAAPIVATRARDLRRFAIDGLLATAVIVPFYLLVPLVVEAKPVPMDSAWAPLLRWERSGDAPVTAFPAFHVVWTLLAADAFTARWPRLRWLWLACTLAIAASCVTTGMHAALDVLAAFPAYLLVRRLPALWRALCRVTERVANSWREWRLGPVRLFNHGLWAALGGVSGVLIATALAGRGAFGWIVATTIAAIVGAALWAQWVEGSPQLLRPYGFFGAVIGTLVGSGIAIAAGHDGWRLLAAMSTGGCATVAFGRLRCLVQGCCHGRPLDASWGTCYRHPRSRVIRLSALGGVPLHPTPLYSALSALLIGAIGIRLWALGAPTPAIAGIVFLLTGIVRFVEEHYRGEPQTAEFAGLRLYQWLAIGMVVVGALFTCVAGAPSPAITPPDIGMLPTLLPLFAFIYAAYGLDFPKSNARFSRLV